MLEYPCLMADPTFADAVFLPYYAGVIFPLLDNAHRDYHPSHWQGKKNRWHESAEDLDVNLLQTEACKKMLLYPKNASEEHCKNLKVFPVTSKSVFTLLYYLGISDASVLEERNVNVGPIEVFKPRHAIPKNPALKSPAKKKKKTELDAICSMVKSDTLYALLDEDTLLDTNVVEASSLLAASLISKTVTDVFYPKKPEHLGKESYNMGKID
ncbi:hypothetical protein MRB53_034943 [Persea americana]|uniref:Uncharacterized protein n=1 Tax=Persea americana TaxID=3435 RepID=A0ACC2K397_PERAE|nr:hypothetical protein MRB53_034943 [Persea americana]